MSNVRGCLLGRLLNTCMLLSVTSVFFNGKTTDKMLTGHQEEGRQKQQVQNPKLMMDSVGPLELCKFYDTQVLKFQSNVTELMDLKL